MSRYLILAVVLFLGWLGAHPARGAERAISLTGLEFYPDDQPAQAGLTEFAWPEQKELSVVASLSLAGYSGDEKVEVFLVLLDANEKVISKHKGKHYLPAGSHDIVFPAILTTEGLFGRAAITAKAEVTLTGAVPAYLTREITLEGPDPPEVQIWEVQLLSADDSLNTTWFEPGEEFAVEATFEVRDNPTAIEPLISVYCVVDEDSNLVDPDYNYQPYLKQWDLRRLGFREGMFHLYARGRMPEYFYYNYDTHHAFRVWIIVDFGHGARTKDYVAGDILDNQAGDNRVNDEVEPRLIEIERSVSWELERVRKTPPDRERFPD